MKKTWGEGAVDLKREWELDCDESGKWTFLDVVICYFVVCGVILNGGVGVFLILLFFFG